MGNSISAPFAPEMDGQTKLHRFRYRLGAGYVRPGDRVLDLGCGTGYGSEIIASITDKVTGIDIDVPQIEFNKTKLPHINFIADDLETMDLPEADVAVQFENLEHLYAPDVFAKKLKAVIKKFIVVSVPCGAEKLIEVDGDIQAEHDSTHHAVFDRQEDLDKLFIDEKWDKFYGFQVGVTYIVAFYNKEQK